MAGAGGSEVGVAPVLLVRARTEAPSGLERLLVPLNCKPDSEVALAAAVDIAQSCNAEVNLAVVVPTE